MLLFCIRHLGLAVILIVAIGLCIADGFSNDLPRHQTNRKRYKSKKYFRKEKAVRNAVILLGK